jgi:hypothetical protein
MRIYRAGAAPFLGDAFESLCGPMLKGKDRGQDNQHDARQAFCPVLIMPAQSRSQVQAEHLNEIVLIETATISGVTGMGTPGSAIPTPSESKLIDSAGPGL